MNIINRSKFPLTIKPFLIVFLVTIQTVLYGQFPTSGLVAFYQFNGNTSDESANEHHGVIHGAKLTEDRCNIDSSAYLFDGIDDYIYMGDIPDFDGKSALTISAWIYTDGIDDQYSGTIVSKYNADGNSERVFIFDLYPNNILRFCIYGQDGNGDYEWQRTSNPIPPSQWNHVVVTWDGTSHNIDIFVNGVEVASYYGQLGNNPSFIYDKASPLMIGASEFGHSAIDYRFNGSIDEVGIYDRVLTFDEISDLYYFNCPDVDLYGENEVCKGQQNVNYSVRNTTDAVFNWSYSGSGANIEGNSDSVSIDFADDATSGILTVIVSGALNTTLSIPITVNFCAPPTADLNIPNAFSPNGDGINDVFYIRGLPENTSVMIFNRNGKLLYESNFYLNDWDGKDIDGNSLESDTYWYVIKIQNRTPHYSGFVHLKR